MRGKASVAKRCAVFLMIAALATLTLPGCGRRYHHSHYNPDGSVSYYRFHRDYTHECVSRTIYHPNCHYYHGHY